MISEKDKKEIKKNGSQDVKVEEKNRGKSSIFYKLLRGLGDVRTYSMPSVNFQSRQLSNARIYETNFLYIS